MIDPHVQDDLGKEIIAQLGSLPGYGAIVWWDKSDKYPLVGTTTQWAIDVRAIDRNDPLHQYDYRAQKHYPHVTKRKREFVEHFSLKGILGILVVLDYRTDMAAIHVKEMPIAALENAAYGWTAKYEMPKLLENVPFRNPYKDHRSLAPHVESPLLAHN